ncbi:type IX secretion system membrane protein PorP/SprF [Pedobacter gandavensis]|uniref:PorP/SprF family type IX secretion system membrane protein n=1 Tax=Pedobacter gandavensis TaxID=2679963 RepID=UPI0024791A89|nr:type IX secretion system membrane protein PorP/SprF [Pedobacter gandavensis]WGQ11290.1 type IX secretion system membrane protein PorP/SprF [Pedobacter gandavensis]
MKTTYKFLALLLVVFTGSNSYAQLNPLAAQYYSNRFLINPAYAGSTDGIRVNAAYRKLWSNVPGSPLTQSLTADYGKGKVGVGLNVYNESAGLQRQTRVTGTYAYHLQLGEEQQQLHFGISLGFMSQRLENSDIYGNPNDPMVGQYNDRKTYLDGDFGIAYTSGTFSLQAAIPNLKSVLKKDVIKLADVTTFYAASSYRFKLTEGAEGMDLEPMIAYRGVQGFDNIWDAGAQLEIANQQVFITGMYHSTKNATFGLGMDFRKKYLISGNYTTQTSALSGYTNGSFELNLRLSLGK